MRKAIILSVFTVVLASAQWIEGEVLLPDSFGGLSYPDEVLYNPGNNNVFVGGSESALLVLDGMTNRRVARIELEGPVYDMLHVPATNMVYVSTGEQVEIIDPAALRRVGVMHGGQYITEICYNRTARKLYGLSSSGVLSFDVEAGTLLTVIDTHHRMQDLCCNPVGNKLYTGTGRSSLEGIYVIDCAGDTIVDSIWTGEGNFKLLYNEPANRLYVTEDDDEDVAIIDAVADTLIGYVWAYGSPGDIARNAEGTRVYVADHVGNEIWIIDAFGDSMHTRLCLGDTIFPDALTYNETDDVLYCRNDGGFVVLDCSGDTVLTVFDYPDTPRATAHNSQLNRLFFALGNLDEVAVLDCATNEEVFRAVTSLSPSALAYSPESRKVYCTSADDHNRLVVIDADSRNVLSMLELPGAADIVLHEPVNNKLYLATRWSGVSTVVVVDCVTDSIVAAHGVTSAYLMATSSSAGKVYAVRQASNQNQVVVFDAATDSIVAILPVRRGSAGIAYNPTSNRVYVSSREWNNVTVIDAARDSVIVIMNVPPDPGVLEWVASRNLMCCICGAIDVVIAIDSSNQVVDTIPVGYDPYALLYNPVANKLYCAAEDYDDITVIDCRTMTPTVTVSMPGEPYMLLDTAANRIQVRVDDEPRLLFFDCAGDSVMFSLQLGLPEYPADGIWVAEDRRFFYSMRDRGCLVMVRDSTVTGVEEVPNAEVRMPNATIVRGMLPITGRNPATLLDITGRRVLDLLPGENDVSSLSPGVYFVCGKGSRGQGFKGSSAKVVIQR